MKASRILPRTNADFIVGETMQLRLTLAVIAAVAIGGTFATGFAYLATRPEQATKAMFVPGSRVVIPFGTFTIEGIVEGPAVPTKLRKGDRLDSKPPVPRSNAPTCSALAKRECRII